MKDHVILDLIPAQWSDTYARCSVVAPWLSITFPKFTTTSIPSKWTCRFIVEHELLLWCFLVMKSNHFSCFCSFQSFTKSDKVISLWTEHLFKGANQSLVQVIYQTLFILTVSEITIFHINKFSNKFTYATGIVSFIARWKLFYSNPNKYEMMMMINRKCHWS